MKFFVISGAPDTGKTTAINLVAEWLCNKYSITTDFYGNPLPSFLPSPSNGKYVDISIVISLSSRKVIIHSATDDQNCMNQLINTIKNNNDAEIVITTCRDFYTERDYFMKNVNNLFAKFFLESPLGKITRINHKDLIKNWYKDTLFKLHQHILSNDPYNL